MLETVEVGARMEKAEYEKAVPDLRVELLNVQYELRNADFPVMIVLSGDDPVGLSEVLNLLHFWMDARLLDAHFFDQQRPVERGYPRFWRYWQVMPGRGEIGLYAGGHGLGLIADHLIEGGDEAEAEQRIENARRIEEMLTDDGALLIKIWIHLSANEQKKRLRKAAKSKNGNRLSDRERELYERYAEAEPLFEAFLRHTSTAAAPWRLVEGADSRHRNMAVAREIRDALVRRLAEPPPVAAPHPHTTPTTTSVPGILASVDLTSKLSRDDYRERLSDLGDRLGKLGVRCREKALSSVLVFEGWDAAGKGGVIRRITRAMDARDYRVRAVAAPTPEEAAHHYLWRFWRSLPGPGRMLICDRSWYGRVLVERVEQLAHESEWGRAYQEINGFEEQLVAAGMPVIKFWLHIDPDTQLARFREREETPYKKYKLTAEDHRNREKRPAYEAAVEDMVARTSTDIAPWHLIPATDKRYARIAVLEKVCEGLQSALA